jgi:Cu(I)/Ag(I) efflux system membrane fusion protein
MIKKIGIYIGCLVFGFIISYLIFGGQNDQNSTSEIDYNQLKNDVWVCSMHPQVKEDTKGTCPLCSMELVLMRTEDSEELLSENQFKMTQKALALANIETSIVGSIDESEVEIHLSGVITTNQETDATQTTIFDGRIEKLYANYVGTKISKGRKIGLVYSPELNLAQNKLLTAVSYRKTHPELFDEVRNSLGLWKITDEQIENMLISQKPMVNFPIYADVSGTVTEIIATEGGFYNQGDPLFKVSNLRTVWAVFDAYENQLKSLKVGQTVVLKSDVFSNGSQTGKIDFIEPILNKKKRTASVRVTLNNSSKKLKPGMLIEANIKSKLSKGVLTIPKTATLWTGKRSIVYKKPIPDKPIFEMTEIVIGQTLKDSYEVLSGLEIGDNIVTDGAFTIDAVAQLQGKKSMMNDFYSDEYQNNNSNNDIHQINWNAINKENYNKLIKDYLAIKDALIASDKEKAKQLSIEMLKALNKVNKEKPSKSLTLLISQINSLISTTDLIQQRLSFKALSETIIDMVSKTKNLDKTIYVQFCPMADQNKGANWLSLEKEIMNPYFGDKMLNCGRVLQTIN